MQPFARSYHKYRDYEEFRMASVQKAFSPVDWAKIYQFPPGYDGSGRVIGIIELGGGYVQADLDQYFAALKLKSPKVNFIPVDGGANAPGNPQGADGEVMLDIEVAAGVANGAIINLYMAPNTAQGFVDAIARAVQDRVDVISISWGGPEDSWDAGTIQGMEQMFVAAAQSGITVTAAAGDNGSSDGEPGTHVDYPSSSPNVLACGGTALKVNSGNVVEVVWNNGSNGGATGGGISTLFGLPAWQQASNVPGGAKRGVPDVAGDADPETGVQVLVDGQAMVIGGTSAVAPMWAGLIAVLNQALGKRVGFINPLLYSMDQSDFNDITQGNNGTFIAKAGWDACTGRGTPKGAAILAAMQGGVVVPPNPVPNPLPTPTPTPTPIPAPLPPGVNPPIAQIAFQKGIKKGIYKLVHGPFQMPVGFALSNDLPAGTYNVTR